MSGGLPAILALLTLKAMPPTPAPSPGQPAGPAGAAGGPATVKVWPGLVRLGHAALAGTVLTCLWLHEGGRWHEALGYAAGAIAAGRVLLGWASRQAALRFSGFVRGPRATLAYARALRHRHEPRHLGHNPLGGWMIVLLLATALAASASGALYATDRFWGDATVHAWHQATGWLLAGLVAGHLLGVLLTSLLQRENLAWAMVTGRKRAPEPGDVGAGRPD